MESVIENVLKGFNFGGHSGCLLFWKYMPLGSGCWVLTMKDQSFRSTKDHKALAKYKMSCLEYGYPNESGRKVDEEWFAGIVVQTRVADQRTTWAAGQLMGNLVVPVFVNVGADQIFLGVIELLTIDPKASHVEDLNQIHNLLKDQNLTTKPLTKTIKVSYHGDMIKFPLPISSGISYLQEEVTKRFKMLNQKAFRIKYKYKGRKGNLPISSEDDLQACIARSDSPTIKMQIELVD